MSGASPNSNQSPPRTLVLGVGNLLLGDEGFGVHAVRRLMAEGAPAWARIVDGGTGGVDLMDLLTDHDRVIVIDALRVRQRDGAGPDRLGDRGFRAMGGSVSGGESPRVPIPGDVVVFRLNTVELLNPDPDFSAHECSLGGLIKLADALHLRLPPIDVVGFVPSDVIPSTELSQQGQRGLDVAVARVREILSRIELGS